MAKLRRTFVNIGGGRAIRHVGMAMLLIRIQQKEGQTRRAYASLRKALCDKTRTGDKPIADDFVRAQVDTAKALSPADMPASTPMVRILLETIACRFHGLSEGEAWEMIGITRYRGHNLLWRGASITWPEWVVLVDGSIGPGQYCRAIPLTDHEDRRLRQIAAAKRSKAAKKAAKTRRRNAKRRRAARAQKVA
jgi:hypothetical protein